MTSAPARADNLWLQTCSFYSSSGSAFTFSTNGLVTAWQGTDSCSTPTQDGSLQIDTLNSISYGRYGEWATVSPPGISIDSAWTPPCSGGCARPSRGVLISCKLAALGFQAYFQWANGGSNSQRIANNDGGACPYEPQGLADGTPINRTFAGTNFFGWYVSCLSKGGCDPAGDTLYIRGIQLGATETGSPAVTATGSGNLYNAPNWIRGPGWAIAAAASDPSGVCNLRATLNGSVIQGPSSGLNRASWVECSVPSWTGPSVNTTTYPDGTVLSLYYQAQNAAGNWTTTPTTTRSIDNAPVTLSLSGPTDASASTGTQRITASATAGPSGIQSITCSVDGSAWTSEQVSGAGTQAASATIPVGGVGSHQVSCYARNHAVDVSGATATSPTQTWALKIGEPVQGGITFAHVVRSCSRDRVRVVRHGHVRFKYVLRCHDLTRERLVERVSHGRPATINGWFATADGEALSYVPVRIVAAPDDGSGAWRTVTVVRTAPDGSWQATLPPGPSRLVEALYAGGPFTEAGASPTATLLVPAKSTLGLTPVVHFGQLAQFAGRLLGGYVPSTGAIVVVQAFDRGHWRNIATVRTDREGSWRAHYAISGGPGVYPIRVWIPRQAGYPWAAALSTQQNLSVRP